MLEQNVCGDRSRGPSPASRQWSRMGTWCHDTLRHLDARQHGADLEEMGTQAGIQLVNAIDTRKRTCNRGTFYVRSHRTQQSAPMWCPTARCANTLASRGSTPTCCGSSNSRHSGNTRWLSKGSKWSRSEMAVVSAGHRFPWPKHPISTHISPNQEPHNIQRDIPLTHLVSRGDSS
jgi:hypothetical protein